MINPAPDSPRPDASQAFAEVPWPEVEAVVGHPPALVLCDDEELLDNLPTGWSRVDEAQKVVVVLDPLDEEAVVGAVAMAAGRPLVVVTPNIGRPSYVRALLLGGRKALLPGRGRLSADDLDRIMAKTGHAAAPAERVPAPAPTGRPLDDLLALVAAGAGGHDRFWSVRRYVVQPAAPTKPAAAEPFLSILVRTQGRRPDALSDVLLCLCAQTYEDFEVLLLAHDVPPDDLSVIESQVGSLPEGTRHRVRIISIEGGGRVRPLSVGTEIARGAYVAILDDDDLVMGHWAEAFAKAAPLAPGQVLRGIAVEQDVEHVDGRPAHRAASWPVTRWDTEFSLLTHIVDNHSPVHSYAYPREVFADLGLRFDESLPVLEDWDLLVRAAALVGVHDTGEVTAMYRRWPETMSSFADLPEERWPETAWQIVDAWDKHPLLLPPGSASRIRHEGIAMLRRRPLRQRVRGRIERGRDRWAPRLARTPLFPALRWAYRRLVRRPVPEP